MCFILSKKSRIFFIAIFFILLNQTWAQNCSVNAGVAETICENTSFNLSGAATGLIQSSPIWSQVGGPSAIIDDPSDLNTTITGLIGGNDYTFRLSVTCTDGSDQFQDIVISVEPITIADAGVDMASCPNNTGNVSISGNTPLNPGETGLWSIDGENNAGVVINFPNSATSTITLPEDSAGVTTLRWTITGPDYAVGQDCESFDTITITNYGGEQPVTAGADQTLDNCYTVFQSTNLNGSFGGNGIGGQQGTWSFVSGPSTPNIADVNNNQSNVTNLIEGTYVFRWTVEGPCASGQDTVTITVGEATQDITNASTENNVIRFCDPTITSATLNGSQPQYSGETVEWTQTSGPTASILNPTNSTTQVSGLDGSSTYQFTYTITNATTGCEDSASTTIRYSTNPITITANSGNDIIAACGQTEVDIPFTTTGNGGNTYAIVNGPSGSSLIDSNNFQNTGSSPLSIDFDVEGTYTVLLRRAVGGSVQTGCNVATDAINVTISLTPTNANAGTPQILACNVTNTSLTGNTVSIGQSLWSQISGPNIATLNNPYEQTTGVSNLIPGIYEFQYSISGGNVCSPSAESLVTVEVSSDAPIVVDAGPDQSMVCFEAPIFMIGDVPTANLQGTWSVDSAPLGTTIIFEDENDPNTMVSGLDIANETYVLRWTIENPNDITCPAPGSDTVTITTGGTQGPSLSDAGPDQCLPVGTTSVTLSANSPQAGETGLWTAFPSTGISFNDATQFNTSANISIEQSYILTWTISKTGCQSTFDEVEITIGTIASADAGPDQSACSDTFTMAATSSTGTGRWTQVSGPGGFTIDNDTSTSAQFTFTFSGQYIFEWTVNNGSCSTDSDQVILNVGIPPTIATVGTDQTICNATNAILSGNGFDSNIETGFWTLLSGAPNTPIIADVNNPNTNVTNLVAGSYIFRWTIVGDSNCPSSFADLNIDVFVPADAGPDLNFCETTNFLLEATFGSTGTWTQTPNGAPAATITQNPVNSNVAEVSITPGNTYIFRFTTDYGASCGSTFDEVTVISSTSPSVDPNAGPDQILCQGDLVVPNQTTLAGNTPPGDVTNAEWRFAEQPSGSVATIDLPNNPSSTLSNLSVPGIYILEWNFESGSCSNTADVVRIEVFEAPSTADAGADQSNACQLDVQMNAVDPLVGIGTWSFSVDPSGGSAVIDSPNSPTTTLSNITTLGTYELTWTVTNGTSFFSPSVCSPSTDTVSITFTDDPPSTANAGPDQEFCDATQTNLNAVALTIGTGTWSQTAGPGVTDPGTVANITSPNNPNSLVLNLEPGVYEFTWTALNGGCTLTDEMEVEIISQPVAAEAGPDQSLQQFSTLTLGATPPTFGNGIWSQLSGPTTVSFIDDTDPTTDVIGTNVGTYEFQWTVSNGICSDVSDTVTVIIDGLADLELTKTVSPNTVNPGDTVTFTISIFNNDISAGSDAAGVSIRDVIPNGYTLVLGTVSNDGVYNSGNFTIDWSNLSIINGSTLDLTFDAIVNATGDYDNTAEITGSNEFDPDSAPNNDISTEDDQDNVSVTIQSADLSMNKTVSPSTASVGETVTFSLEVVNAGTDNATGVSIQDIVPSGYNITTINDGGVQSGNTITWSGLSVTNGGSTTVTFTATLNPPTGVTNEYLNTAQVIASDQNDPDSDPNNDNGDQSEDDEDSAQVTLEQVDLQLGINNSTSSGNVNDTVDYTVSVFNNDAIETGDATNVEVVVTLPSGMDIVPGSITNGGVYNPGSGTITWSGLDVANGVTLDLEYQVTINDNGNYGTIGEITASDLPDTDSTPNNDDGDQSEDDEDSAAFALQSADLSLVKDVSASSNDTPNVDDTIVFELTITNSGPDTATNVRLEDEVPSGYTLETVNNGGTAIAGTFLSWDIASLPVGSTTVTYEVTVNEPNGFSDEYLNIAEITASNQDDPDSEPFNDDGDQSEDDEDFFIVTPQVIDLELNINVSNTNPNVGDVVTFTIDISNLGDVSANGVAIENLLPSGFGNITGINNGGSLGAVTINWSGLNVPVGNNTLTLTFNAEVLEPTGNADEYEHVAQITGADQFDTDSTPNNDNGDQSEDDEDNVGVTPQQADLSLVKTVSDLTPDVGDTVIFTLTMTNQGPNVASGVALEDTLPTGYTLTTVNDGGSQAINTASWNSLTVLANGGTTSVTYEAIINTPSGTAGEYVNSAQITASDQFDPDSNPNTDTTVDEDGNGNGDDDDEDTLTVSPNIGDLELTKIVVDGDTTPLVGSEISFEITVLNVGDVDANNVVVQDLLPSGYNFELYSATSGIYNENTGIWQVGNVSAGGNETIVIDVLVNPNGNYTNVAEVISASIFDVDSTPNNDVLTEDDQDNVVVTPIEVADLSLTKTVSTTTPDIADNVIFTITVTNDGPSNATGIQVLDVLPSGFSYNSDDSGGAYVSGTGIWSIANLANGASAALNITASVNTTGNYTNVAEVIAHDQLDEDSTPNNTIGSEDDQDEVVVTPRQMVDISVTKSANTNTPNIGSNIIFTITVTNDGPSDATDVVVTDLLESGYEYVSAIPSVGTYEPLNGSWTVGNLANAVTETLTIEATVLTNGIYTNTAELTDLNEDDIDSLPANNDDTEDDQQTIEPIPVLVSDLELSKTVDNPAPMVGETIEFTINLTNNGPSDTAGVSVLDIISSGYTYVSNTVTAGNYNQVSGIWSLNGTLPNGTTETLEITAIVNPTGNYANTAEIWTSDNLDIDSTPGNTVTTEDDYDEAITAPIPIADVSLTKTVDNEFPDVSDQITFTLTLNNTGPSEATSIQIRDVLPTGYSYVSDDGGGTYNPTTGIWGVSSLAADTTTELNITVGINTTGSYLNIAELIAVNEQDPNSTPNNNNPSEDDQDEQVTLPRVITDISLVKTANNLAPSVGTDITFTITVTNDGPSDATGLVIEDILASGYNFVSSAASAGSYDNVIGSWDIPTLPNGATETLEIIATVLSNGDYSNTAELIALNTFDPDSTPDNNLNSEDDQDTVNPVPTGLADLSIAKTVDNANPKVGDIIEFTINLTNNGDSNATGVVVNDLLPIGFTYQAHTATAGTYDEDTGVWNTNGVIPNGTTETLLILARVNAPTGADGEYTNQVEITASDQADPDSDVTVDRTLDDFSDGLADDDEALVVVTPQSVDIEVQKTVSNPRPNIGSEITFTIIVTNNGAHEATNIGIEERLPNGYRLISANTTLGAYDTSEGFWEIDTLNETESATLTLLVEVLDIEDYQNTAVLAFVDQFDIDNSNDLATASIEPTCLMFYNEFSPNGDGVNETFVIDCISKYPNNTLKIYNRWGNIVYEKQGYNNEFNGTSNGRAVIQKQEFLPVGTYYYILNLGDGSDPITDWLYINR
ncbi:gliding motility-associated C-terminal domain-containing protein [Croceitalea marina]|uniref:Gliding motility-associated C-terminal domain-containing protein n=1 Tax=Croceitalea marina TaxID=1775166 RepID=A0ABW5N417_9FLAO